MIDKPALICIPDISGFTRFMSETNSELSHKVIPSLLNQIIYSNEIDLKISEIEGDAILFYRYGALPKFNDLVEQCRTFFRDFYNKLDQLAAKNSANADSDNIPKMLGLKIILHYGDHIEPVQIGTRLKLMGEDVIIAHRLLKNDIKSDEYILFSEKLLDQYQEKDTSEIIDNKHIKDGDDSYSHLGDINYKYIELS